MISESINSLTLTRLRVRLFDPLIFEFGASLRLEYFLSIFWDWTTRKKTFRKKPYGFAQRSNQSDDSAEFSSPKNETFEKIKQIRRTRLSHVGCHDSIWELRQNLVTFRHSRVSLLIGSPLGPNEGFWPYVFPQKFSIGFYIFITHCPMVVAASAVCSGSQVPCAGVYEDHQSTRPIHFQNCSCRHRAVLTPSTIIWNRYDSYRRKITPGQNPQAPWGSHLLRFATRQESQVFKRCKSGASKIKIWWSN